MEARLVHAGLAGVPLDWGYEVVADALERSDAVLDFEVPAAARWVVRCAGLFKRGAEGGGGELGVAEGGGFVGRGGGGRGEDESGAVGVLGEEVEGVTRGF